ncbi:hypothetical protein HDU96_004719 [Phlyctochytrium bullatum]|nr:hypothetical protein HDU96_004719 [Phlyctochytrium bullatum]
MPGPMFSHLKSTPYLAVLASAVGLTALTGGWFISHQLRNNPNVVVVNKRQNPFPWLQVDQGTNLKLYAVNRKFEKKE